MTGKHKKTLHAIYDDPVRANILWADIEALLMALGSEREEGSGSRVHFFQHTSIERLKDAGVTVIMNPAMIGKSVSGMMRKGPIKTGTL